MSRLYDLVEQPGHVRPQRGCAVGNRRIARPDLFDGHVMAAPRHAFAQAVEEHRLTPVDRVGELRVGRQSGFEFVPMRAEFGRLIVGKEAEDPVRGQRFAFVLVGEGAAAR